MEQSADWQVVTITYNWVDEVDCNSGRRRRVYSSGEIQEIS